MKITRLETILVDLPLERPIRTAIHEMTSVGGALTRVHAEGGLYGEGYVFTMNGARIRALSEAISGLAPLLAGEDADFIERIWRKVWSAINFIGHKGVSVAALSAIDTALWDLKGKAAGQPLHRLFGACRERVRTYASGGLWLDRAPDELVREAEAFIAQGFRAMKLRVGKPDWREDLERARILRQAVGPDIELMVDANQGMTAKQAVRLGRRLEELDYAWFEEPVPAYDLDGHAEVRARLDMPVASGETEYTSLGIRAMIEAKAADILMPDLMRMGGPSEFRRAAALAAAHNLPVSSHIFTEQSLCLGGSVANCISVEHMPWFAPLYNEAMTIENGDIVIPERPGVGFTFSDAAIARYRVG